MKFSSPEHHEFGVGANVPIDSALDTADEFHRIGLKLAREAGVALEPADNLFLAHLAVANHRAYRMIVFSNKIVELCPGEYMQRVLSTQPTDT